MALLDWLPLIVAPLAVRGTTIKAAPATRAMLIACLALFPVGLMTAHIPAFSPAAMLRADTVPSGLAMILISSFFHTGLDHLIWNLAPVLAIGPYVESRLGTNATWGMAAMAMLASGLFDILLFRHTDIASVGFSAVVCAYLGALIMIGPVRWVWVWLAVVPVPLPAFTYVAIMFALLFPNLVGLSLPPVARDFTNHMAHYAGFGAGLALAAALWAIRHFCLIDPATPAAPATLPRSPPIAPLRSAPRSPTARRPAGGAERR